MNDAGEAATPSAGTTPGSGGAQAGTAGSETAGSTSAGGAENESVAGQPGIDTITKFDASSFACRFAGEVSAYHSRVRDALVPFSWLTATVANSFGTPRAHGSRALKWPGSGSSAGISDWRRRTR